MEFSEKLAQLRKGKGLTQEQLAKELYVSRTAVSKWENGRGTPSIDSLRAIAKFFDVTVDELLSADAVLEAALSERRELSLEQLQLASAWLSLVALACFVLPLYKSHLGDAFTSVPLYQLESSLAPVFAIAQLVMAVCGVAALLATRFDRQRIAKILLIAGDALCAVLALVFALASQPYPACVFLVLLVSKMFIRIKLSQVTAS